MPSSPAEKVGVKKGDFIVAINDVSVGGKVVDTSALQLRGIDKFSNSLEALLMTLLRF